jgi:hypothetical protein
MKLQPKRLLAALLAGLMILPTAACATGDDPTETQSPGATSAETEADTSAAETETETPEAASDAETE